MKTKSFTVDAVGNPEPITVVTTCQQVEIYEDAQAGTTDYKVRAPSLSDVDVQRPAGAKTLLRPSHGGRFFFAGETIGYVSTVAGVVTFAQEEN